VYLSGYDHDIFVSYVRQDELSEWTERLREELGKALNLILFLKPPAALVDVWIDDRLRLNLPLDGELKCRVERSALLLIIMSPLYLRSDWCGKEVAWFAAAANQRSLSNRRVFVVHAFPTDRTGWPEPLSGLLGYQFFARHPVAQQELPLGFIGDKDDSVAFKQALYNLAGQIKAQLDELRTASAAPPPPPPASIAPKAKLNSSRLVCLETIGASAVGKDLTDTVRRMLSAHKVDIFVPSELGDVPRDPVGAERYLQRLTKAKANCDGLILLRLDPAVSLADWLLDYIADIQPMARRIRPDLPDPRPLIIDTCAGGPALPKEIQLISASDSVQLEQQLGSWIADFSPAEPEMRQ